MPTTGTAAGPATVPSAEVHVRDIYSWISNDVLASDGDCHWWCKFDKDCSQSSLIIPFVCIIVFLIVIACANGCGSNTISLYLEINWLNVGNVIHHCLFIIEMYAHNCYVHLKKKNLTDFLLIFIQQKEWFLKLCNNEASKLKGINESCYIDVNRPFCASMLMESCCFSSRGHPSGWRPGHQRQHWVLWACDGGQQRGNQRKDGQ